MKKVSFLFLLLIVTPVLAEEVPEAWLDSLESNLDLMEIKGKFSSFRMRNIVDMLDKEGEVEESDTTWMKVFIDENGDKAVYETDFMGIPKSDKPIDNEGEDDEIGPFDMVKAEYRKDYKFEIIDDNSAPFIKIKIQAVKKLKEGFEGVAVIDTSTWRFNQTEVVPVKFPKMVKDMSIKIEVDNSNESHSLVKRIETKVFAKILLIKYRTKIIQELFDFQEK